MMVRDMVVMMRMVVMRMGRRTMLKKKLFMTLVTDAVKHFDLPPPRYRILRLRVMGTFARYLQIDIRKPNFSKSEQRGI